MKEIFGTSGRERGSKIFIDKKNLLISKPIDNKLFSWSPNRATSFPSSPLPDFCSCKSAPKPSKTINYDKWTVPNYEELSNFREKDIENFKKSKFHSQNSPPLILSKAQSSIEYVSYGYDISPEEQFNPYLKVVADENEHFKFEFTATYGYFLISKENVNMIRTKDEYLLVLNEWALTEDLNEILKDVQYIPKIYDARPLTDIVHFKLTHYSSGKEERVAFPVTIRRRELPILQLRRSDEISEMVTIVTKTGLRPSCLKTLISSIREFYPKVTIIVADDSPKSEIKTDEFPGVKYYLMPEEEGFFAGRALVISQVRTPYFIWVDDDFIFTEDTKLEKFVEVAEESQFDIVGGLVVNKGDKKGADWNSYDKISIQYSAEGNCYKRDKHQILTNLPGFEENCIVNDIVKNFFIGRTSTAGSIRMDPNFSQRGHREFFLDSIGKLRIAFCDFVTVYHGQEECIKSQPNIYAERRHPHGSNLARLEQSIAENWFFRNYFSCQTDFT
ncbi:Oidioi.mRNA.OKI2018_I69.PAR.g12158.t2.cds [Oikopleura dioica]|nr:Oidioi.mRNA.OKI2018_I69.PAR.g12158.t2.cds [Oikopleura dioica]